MGGTAELRVGPFPLGKSGAAVARLHGEVVGAPSPEVFGEQGDVAQRACDGVGRDG